GTPSLFAPASIAAILGGASERIAFARDCEVTLETNPGTVEHGRFEGYLEAGVNRISFGIQSFDDDKLRALGRIHSAAEAEAAVELARDAGYANINLDLMYALPNQRLDGALCDIERAIALRPTHVSHYQLTLEPGTPFAKRPPPLPDHDAAWDMQEACQARLAEAGFAQYEVSAYALPGQRCRHNLNYWRFGDYLGIGAGAHGKISGPGTKDKGPKNHAPSNAPDRHAGSRPLRGPVRNNDEDFCVVRAIGNPALAVRRRWKVRSPHAYLQSAATPYRVGGDETVTADQLSFEFMLNVLRLNEGVAVQDFLVRTGLPMSSIAAPLRDACTRGLLTGTPDRLQATPRGQRFLNDLIETFLPSPKPGHRHA
ncbi:MAG: radical SAM family heme chaperone HemW, partial [Rhodanobacteraceae bacterium]